MSMIIIKYMYVTEYRWESLKGDNDISLPSTKFYFRSFMIRLTILKNSSFHLKFESLKISLTHPLHSLTCLFNQPKLNSLLCFELLFHKPLKNAILAQRSTSNSSSSEIFPLVTICLASFFSFESSSFTHKSRCQFRARTCESEIERFDRSTSHG